MNIKMIVLPFFASAMLAMPLLGASAVVDGAKAYDSCARCDRLWYQRNVIFARKGKCFKTKRARAVFGRRCYPPYGKLNRSEWRRVNRIIRRERYSACARRCW